MNDSENNVECAVGSVVSLSGDVLSPCPGPGLAWSLGQMVFWPGLVKKCRGPRFPRAFLTRPFRIIWAKSGKNKQISTVL